MWVYENQTQLIQLSFQVEEMEVIMPNQHYFTIDMTKMGLSNKDEVSLLDDTK